MAIIKLQAEGINLADNFAFTGNVSGAGENNTPIVFAQANSGTNVATATATKITLDNEIVDTNNLFSSSRFTVTSTTQGKYLIVWQISFNLSTDGKSLQGYIKKNGTTIAASEGGAHKSGNQTCIQRTSVITNLVTDDYIEFFGRHDHGDTRANNGDIYTQAAIILLAS